MSVCAAISSQYGRQFQARTAGSSSLRCPLRRRAFPPVAALAEMLATSMAVLMDARSMKLIGVS
jgi:hypothetical protein